MKNKVYIIFYRLLSYWHPLCIKRKKHSILCQNNTKHYVFCLILFWCVKFRTRKQKSRICPFAFFDKFDFTLNMQLYKSFRFIYNLFSLVIFYYLIEYKNIIVNCCCIMHLASLLFATKNKVTLCSSNLYAKVCMENTIKSSDLKPLYVSRNIQA